MSIDTTELQRLVADLRGVDAILLREIRPAVSRAGLNMKRQLVAEMSASRHFAPVAAAMSYETRPHVGGVEVLVGPKRGAPGSLANVAYFGTSRGGGTVPDPAGALNAEAPRFVSALEEIVAEMLR